MATDNGLFRKQGQRLERVDNRPGMPANAFHGVLEDRRGRIWAGAPIYTPSSMGSRGSSPLTGRIARTASSPSLKQMTVPSGSEPSVVYTGFVPVLSALSGLAVSGEPFAPSARSALVNYGPERSGRDLPDPLQRKQQLRVAQDAPSPQVSNTILSIVADDIGNIWVGTQVGMVRLSRTPVEVLSLPQAADSDFGTVSLDADGSLWAASNQLVHVKDGQAKPFRFPELGDARARNLLRTRDGSLWIGTDGSGLFRFSAGSTAHYTMLQGLPNNFIRCMIEAVTAALDWYG